MIFMWLKLVKLDNADSTGLASAEKRQMIAIFCMLMKVVTFIWKRDIVIEPDVSKDIQRNASTLREDIVKEMKYVDTITEKD